MHDLPVCEFLTVPLLPWPPSPRALSPKVESRLLDTQCVTGEARLSARWRVLDGHNDRWKEKFSFLLNESVATH